MRRAKLAGDAAKGRDPFAPVRRYLCAALLLLGAAGCVSPRDERLQEYTEDGVHLYQQGAYADAQATFQAALTLKPDDANLLYNAGQCCQRRGAAAQARQYYQQCLERDQNHAPCRFALAQLLVQAGQPRDAEVMIQEWLSREPTRAEPYALDGWYWHQAGDLPRAQGRLQQALDLDPHNSRALIEMGLVYEGMRREDRAVVLYERVLADDPTQKDVDRRLQGLLTRGAGKPRPE